MTGDFPSQRPATRSVDVFFDLQQMVEQTMDMPVIDLRRRRSQYDVTVMRNDALVVKIS